MNDTTTPTARATGDFCRVCRIVRDGHATATEPADHDRACGLLRHEVDGYPFMAFDMPEGMGWAGWVEWVDATPADVVYARQATTGEAEEMAGTEDQARAAGDADLNDMLRDAEAFADRLGGTWEGDTYAMRRDVFTGEIRRRAGYAHPKRPDHQIVPARQGSDLMTCTSPTHEYKADANACAFKAMWARSVHAAEAAEAYQADATTTYLMRWDDLVVTAAVRAIGADFTLRPGELVQAAGFSGSAPVWDVYSAERGEFRIHEGHVRRATRAEAAAVSHDRAMPAGDGFVCDCGHPCPDMREWHAHTARAFNNPRPTAVRARGGSVHTLLITIAPGTVATVEKCTKVACSNEGNGRECWCIWELADPDSDHGRMVGLFGLPSEAVARDILAKGATLSRTYTMNVC